VNGYSTVEDGHGFVEWMIRHVGQKVVWVLSSRKGCGRRLRQSNDPLRIARWK
jgi:hypothetical protein